MIPYLNNEDFCRILRLYKYDVNTCRKLLEKIKETGVNNFFNYGPRNVYGKLRIVGVGFTGILVLASASKGIVLVKILRKDSRRNSMLHECSILEEASRLGVSPRAYSCSNEYIVMEYIDGYSLAEYIENFDKFRFIYDLRIILKSILYKTFLLDKHHIDHGELSRPYKHVLVSPKGVFIIDFDSASKSRTPRNLASILGGLFFRQNKFSKTIIDNLQVTSNYLKEIPAMIKEYKKQIGFNIVVEIIEKLNLT